MKIAIPSYNRVKSLGEKTLSFLKTMNGFELADISIFVANQEQFDLYSAEYPDYNIIIGEKGIVNIRNFINKHYDLDEYVVCLDDDVERLNIHSPDFFIEGEKELNESGLSLWGVNPISNSYFMSNKVRVTYNLKFSVGGMFGMINKKFKLNSKSATKEDIEQSILHYLYSKGVVRFNHIAFKSKMFAEGGIGNQKDRLEQNEIAVSYLLETYPTLTSLFVRKNKWKEIRLRWNHCFKP